MKWSKPLPATNCELKEEWNCYYIKATVLKTADIMENFILYEELGSGSRSVVYKGRRKGSLNYVAIVCADKSKRPEITNHVRLSHDLSHGNIVAFYEWYETSNHLWVVTELCTGGSLEGVIGQDGCLSEEVVKEFGRDLVRGLRHIHQSGIIFSELTPAKILLDGPGVLKFSNFCQSKAEGETLEEFFSLLNTSEQSGGGGRGGRGGGDEKKNPDMNDRRKRIQGCPLYTAPEVLKGAETSCSSDLWALGCILYYMYTGKPPFYSDSYTELTDMILHKEPPAARQTGSSSPPSEEFQRLLKGLLIKDPEKRMGWSELLTQPFWTQILEEEDEEEEGEGSDVSDDSISPGYPYRQQEAIEPAPPERETDKTSTCTHRGGDRARPRGAEQNCHTLYHKSFTLDNVSELKPKHVDKDNTEAFFLRSNTSGRKSNGPDKDSNNF